MFTKHATVPQPPSGLETVKYPPEVIERLRKELTIVDAQIAVGELVPKSVEEYAAELGIDIDAE